MKKIIIFIVSFFLCLNVYATDECTNSELQRLNELANNVTFRKSYKINADNEYKEINTIYNIEVLNYNEDLKIYYKTKYDTQEIEVTASSLKETDFFEDDTITFSIKAYTSNLCTTRLLKTVTVNLPVYNEYYYFNKEKCDSNPDFKYCKEFMDVDISSEEIDKLFNEYLDNNKVTKQEKKDNKAIIYGSIVIVLVIIIVSILIIFDKRKKKDDL